MGGIYTSFGKPVGGVISEVLSTKISEVYILAKGRDRSGMLAECFSVMATMLNVGEKDTVELDRQVRRRGRHESAYIEAVGEGEACLSIKIPSKILHSACCCFDHGSVTHILVRSGEQAKVIRMWKHSRNPPLNIAIGQPLSKICCSPVV
jgi:hypothetical protein